MISNPQTILVTGGSGFAGRHLVDYLSTQFDSQIIATTHSKKNNEGSAQVRYVSLDLTNRDAVFELNKTIQPDWIFHLAAISVVGSSFDRASEIFHNNLAIQLNLLEAVHEHSPEARVLVVGSGTEYGKLGSRFHTSPSDQRIREASKVEGSSEWKGFTEEDLLQPLSPYAVSKVTQDLLGLSYFLSYDLDIVRVRPFNHIGEGQSREFAIPSFAHQIVQVEKGEQQAVKVGNLEAIRDITDVKDVVKAYVKVMQVGQRGEVYNIGSGNGSTMRGFLDMMISLAKVPIDVQVDASRLRPDSAPLVANIEKIKKLGWQPEIPIEQSLQRVLNEWRRKDLSSLT